MCISATVLLVASTAVSAYGAYQQAQAQKAQYEYQAQVARNNAVIAGQNERDIVQRGEVAREIQRTRVQQAVGSARAKLGGTGLLVDDTQGSTAATLQEDLRVAGAMDIMTMKSNIDRQARQARIQGINFEAQAGLYDLGASSINPMLSAVTAGLGNAPSLYNAFGGGQPTTLGAPSKPPLDLIGA